jgi:hypothetical protein
MNNRPQVLIAEAFINAIRLSNGDEDLLMEWVNEMEHRIVLLRKFDETLFGVFADDSALCLPDGVAEEVPWFCGSVEHLIKYLREYPQVAGQLGKELVAIINEYPMEV